MALRLAIEMSQLPLHAVCPKVSRSDGPVVLPTAVTLAVLNLAPAASTTLRHSATACNEHALVL